MATVADRRLPDGQAMLSTAEFRTLHDRLRHGVRRDDQDRLGTLGPVSLALVALAERQMAVSDSDDDGAPSAMAVAVARAPAGDPRTGAPLGGLPRTGRARTGAPCRRSPGLFRVMIASLRLPTGTGSPVDPVAVF